MIIDVFVLFFGGIYVIYKMLSASAANVKHKERVKMLDKVHVSPGKDEIRAYLGDKSNAKEIEAHMSEVLSKILGKRINYCYEEEYYIDLCELIYYAEAGKIVEMAACLRSFLIYTGDIINSKKRYKYQDGEGKLIWRWIEKELREHGVYARINLECYWEIDDVVDTSITNKL